jgi:hypothetical protein
MRVEERLDFRRIQDDIARRPPREWTWLEASYAEPAVFLDQLYNDHAARRRLSARSKVGVRTSLFAEFVQRHGGERGVALRTYSAGIAKELSYAGLLSRACQRAAFLSRRGIEPGAVVCIVARMGESLSVDVMALLKLGAVVATIEPRGPLFVRNRIEGLAPDFVIADASYGRWWAALVKPPVLIPDVGIAADAGVDAIAYSYAADEEAMRLYSPLAEDPLLPVSVTADALLSGAIRDALLVYRIGPGDNLGAPLFDFHQHQPALLLAATFAGATLVHIDDEELRRRPDLLPALGLRVAGLTNEIRANEVDEKTPYKIGAERWFSSLAEPLDIARIQYDATALAKRGSNGILTMANAAFGGTFIFAPHPASVGVVATVATPGQSWSLVEANGSGMPAVSAGVFLPTDFDPAAVGQFVMGLSGRDHYFGGAARLTRNGQVLCAKEIALVAESQPSVLFASLVLGAGRLPNTSRAVLLVFVSALTPDPALADVIRARIVTELGAAALPDRVELYPLVPRLIDGRPDDVWCSSHYFSGRLERKRTEPLFGAIAAARRSVLRLVALSGAS